MIAPLERGVIFLLLPQPPFLHLASHHQESYASMKLVLIFGARRRAKKLVSSELYSESTPIARPALASGDILGSGAAVLSCGYEGRTSVVWLSA